MHQINHEIPSSSSSLSFAPPATSVAAMSLGFAASATSQSISSYSTPFLTLTPTPYGNSTWGNGTSAGAENGECRLLGPFALLVQAALGLLALLSLVFKRWRERPQRPVKIWGFDASKQVVGSSLLHVANLFMSMVSSGSGDLKPKAGDFQANPCSFYLLNLAIDTTIGIPILIVLLRLLTHAFSLTPLGDPPESIQSGNYGRPPKAKWWLKQCLIYFVGLLGMKLCVYGLFQICPWIIKIGDWALRWTEGNETVQVFFVMLFFPLIMNALQYYIIDGFIKSKKPNDHELIPSQDGSEDGEGERRPRRARHSADTDRGTSLNGAAEVQAVKDDADVSVSEATEMLPAVDKAKERRGDDRHLEEYDPTLDGEASSTNGNGTSGKPFGAQNADERAKDSH